jgi:hypothetical protein
MDKLSRMTGRLMLVLALALPAMAQAQTPEASKAAPPSATQDTAKEARRRSAGQQLARVARGALGAA